MYIRRGTNTSTEVMVAKLHDNTDGGGHEIITVAVPNGWMYMCKSGPTQRKVIEVPLRV